LKKTEKEKKDRKEVKEAKVKNWGDALSMYLGGFCICTSFAAFSSLGLNDTDLGRAQCPSIEVVASLLHEADSAVGFGGIRDLKESFMLIGVELLSTGVKTLQPVPLKHLKSSTSTISSH